MPTWTKEKVEELKRRWAAQETATQIARALGPGFTKNAVIGKARREDCPLRLPGSARKRRPDDFVDRFNIPIARPNRPHLQLRRSAVVAKPTSPPRALVKPPRPAGPWTPSPQKLDTLEEHHCRYPIGEPGTPEFHFCGADKIPGVSYCQPHAKIAYQNFGVTPAPRPHKNLPHKKKERV